MLGSDFQVAGRGQIVGADFRRGAGQALGLVAQSFQQVQQVAGRVIFRRGFLGQVLRNTPVVIAGGQGRHLVPIARRAAAGDRLPVGRVQIRQDRAGVGRFVAEQVAAKPQRDRGGRPVAAHLLDDLRGRGDAGVQRKMPGEMRRGDRDAGFHGGTADQDIDVLNSAVDVLE